MGGCRLSTPLALAGASPPSWTSCLASWGCWGVELASTDLWPRSPAIWRAIRSGLAHLGLSVAAIVSCGDGQGGEQGWPLRALKQAFESARFLGAQYVVTLPPPRGGDPQLEEEEEEEEQVAAWLDGGAHLARQAGIRLLVENHPATWADTGPRMDWLLSRADPSWIAVSFDPAGFVAAREHPFLFTFKPCRLKSSVQLVRMSDALFACGLRVPMGHGNAELKEMVSALLARGYSGLFSIESAGAYADTREVERTFADFHALIRSLAVPDVTAPSGPDNAAKPV